MATAGHLTNKQLVEVEPGVFLATRQARAYRRVKAAFRAKGKNFKPVNEFSGYRSEHVQNGMADASRSRQGSAARRKYELSATSTVPVSYHPNGSHEFGTALDFLIDGSSAYPSEADRKLLAKHGWKFQFGKHDQNHVKHDNIHSVTPVTRAWCIKNHIWVQPK